MRYQSVSCALALFAFLFPALIGSARAEEPTRWVVEVADSAWSIGFVSLALDATDRPHLSYMACDVDQCSLMYAFHDGSDWRRQVVESSISAGAFASLALDRFDRPHISYSSREPYSVDDDLKYAYFDGTDWHIQVAEAKGSGGMTSLALDATGQPHITYWDNIADALKYARYENGHWRIEKIDGGRSFGFVSSLALDIDGNPHVSCYDYRSEDLYYAYSDGSTWYIEEVDASGRMGFFSSLALDQEGHPHISYYDSPNRLKYAFHDGRSWTSESVEGDDAGRYNSLALDSAGRPHISYHKRVGDENAVNYAYHTGAEWHIEMVATQSSMVMDTSLVLDRAGQPHIAFSCLDCGDVMYAYRTTEPPLPATGNPAVGYWALVASGVSICVGLALRRRVVGS